jgi:glycosyltransferase involved in cell wall biosynthesis
LIILSTFNGERYLAEQLNSIVMVHYDGLEVLARDDGSTDATIDILNDFAQQFSWFRISKNSGTHLGIANSYVQLLEESLHLDLRYLSFCDQDDIWIGDRFSDASDYLDASIPTLLVGSLTLVDKNSQPLKEARKFSKPGSHYFSIFFNQATGCALVINKELAKLIVLSKPHFTNEILHDWRAYLLAAFFGEVKICDNEWVLYRQHDNNSVGYSHGIYRILKFIRTLHLNLPHHTKIASELLQIRRPMNLNSQLFLESTARLNSVSFCSRIKYIFTWKIHRPGMLGSVATYMNILRSR